jgi:hypothetical protein
VKPSPSGSEQSGDAKACWPREVSIETGLQTGAWLTTSTLKLMSTDPPSLSETTVVQLSGPL